MTKKKILIATGGTGGHVFPAYSLANYLSKKNYAVQISTDKRGLNYLKNYENLNLIKIPSSPLVKKNIIELLFSVIIIIFSTFKSLIYLLFNRPLIVFGMGGYSSFPICFAASILRIKSIVYENNLIIGKANKFLLPFVRNIFVSYKDLEGVPKKYRYKVFEIGNIIREEIIHSKIYAYNENRFDLLKILVLGGSQAAKIFAEELPDIFRKCKDLGIPIKIFQQCHEEQNQKLSQFYENAKIEFEIFNFTNKIIEYYSKCNFVITRSGASVLGELLNTKIPFVSIPLPSSADNHQYKNAQFYSKKGYGYLLEEKDIKSNLLTMIKSFFEDKSLIKNMILKQEQYSDKNIFSNLSSQLEKIIYEKN